MESAATIELSESPRDAITRLEERIETLHDKLESCRKFAAAGRFAMAFGAVLLLGLLLGLMAFAPLPLFGGLTALIGGVVVFGSNNSSARATEAEIEAARAERMELIGRMELRVVGGTTAVH